MGPHLGIPRARRTLPAAVLLLAAALSACSRGDDGGGVAARERSEAASFVGSERCAGCHDAPYRRWRASHHQLAMQAAAPGAVLGAFDGTTLRHNGARSRFFMRDAEYWVETTDVAGKPQAFRIDYAFGVEPLQQYLIAFPGGRYQALTVGWDSRPASAGGQRWFDLQAHGPVPPGDALHWTGANYNWNSRCAECHTTGLRRNYDAAADRYATSWAESGVGCEACHGPGSAHLAWAAARPPGGERSTSGSGLTAARLAPIREWTRAPRQLTATPVAAHDAAAHRARQLDVCGPCHARRQALVDDAAADLRPAFHDAYALALPTPPLYHADGQIREEDFELGSFLQSRMHARGVACSNCHDPHSLQLRAPGNAVCAQCHDPAAFDAAAHHHHAPGTPGARCVDCHMPATTYMVVDARHDHSLRIPRPDLTVRSGTPNACGACHARRGAAWAAEQVQAWRRAAGKPQPAHFSEALVAADPAAWSRLAGDAAAPGIARAAALSRLARQPDEAGLARASASLRDIDPLARRAAVGFFEALEPARRIAPLAPLSADPSRSVRLEVARLLAPTDLASLPAAQRPALQRLFEEYVAALESHRYMPGDVAALGVFHLERGDPQRAEQAYRHALRLDAHYTPAALNLADLYRQLGREDEARGTLEEALRQEPVDATLHYALGLQRVRARAYAEALGHLRRAYELAPDDAGIGYAYAVALFDSGAVRRAIDLLQQLQARHPADPLIDQALAEYRRRAGGGG